MKRILRSVRAAESGTSMIEVLVALAILGATGLAFLGGLATEAKAGMVSDEQTTAESLARSQMEYVRRIAYQTGATQYPADPALVVPSGWILPASTVRPVHVTDDGIQKVTVTVQHGGKTVFTLEGYKRQ